MTAAVFAEILVIGFQTFAFIALAVVALVGLPSSDPATVDVVKAWGPVLAVPVLGIAYTLGVVMDRIADFVTKWQDNKLRKAVTGTGPKVTEMRHAILAKQEAVMKPLEYSLSRLRIARATFINAALILACASWIARTTGSSFWGVTAVASGLVSVASIYAWYDLASSYYKRVAEAYRETSEMTSTLWSRVSVRKLQREVAAVCYRRTDSGLRFLLVKTGSGNWTFPKGHVEPGMSESEAAHREAEEEAGASGAVLPEPLTTYLYVKSNSAEQFAIRAYLLDVRDTRPPAESWRKPAWYSRKDAKKKLAENRAPEYADELARVIELAVDQLRQ